MMELSVKDRNLIKSLREEGVLQDVREHLLAQRNGTILVTCSDGDQFVEVFHHQEKLQAGQRSRPRIHTFGWHGGVLACAPHSPVNKREHDHLVFLDQIGDGRTMKNINTVVACAHAPCGAAHKNGLGIEKVITLQFRAKQRIETLNRGITVACFFDVDYGNGRKRTYFLSRPEWRTWARKNSVAV